MTITVKAKYAKGVLTLLEPLDLAEGTEVVVSVDEQPVEEEPTANSLLEIFDRMHRVTPEETWANLPVDGSKNVDHYLYGWPKVEG